MCGAFRVEMRWNAFPDPARASMLVQPLAVKDPEIRAAAPVAAVMGDGGPGLARPVDEVDAGAADGADLRAVAFLVDEHVARLATVGRGLVDDATRC